MTNKLLKRRPNNLLSPRSRYYAFGDFLFKAGDDGKVTNRSLSNLSDLGEGIFKAAGTAAGQIGGNLIGGGMQSGAGNLLSRLSGIAGAIPGPWGAIACLCEGQRVITRDGRFVNIEDLTPDDGIIGFSEQTNSISPQTTTLQMLELYKPCVRIELQSGLNLECSTDHPVYIADSGRATRKYVDGIRTRVKTYSYVKAENIKVGQYAGVIDEVPIFGNLNVEKAYLIGMLIGDGSYTKRSIVALHTGDEDTWNYVESNNYGVVVNRFDSGERYSKEFRTYRIIDGCQMMRKLGLYGQSKSTKTLPNNIHLWNKESIANLIAGLWDTDGYVTIESNDKKKHRICFCQSNLSLIRAVQEQLIKFGIHSSIKINKPKKGVIKGKQVNSKEAYVLIIKDKKSCMRFTENIHLNIGYKQKNLDRIKEITKVKFTKDNSFIQGIHADKIISITPIGVQRIYNLEAHQDHNYIANFIVTHNSAGLGLVGGLTNRMFGSKLNEENIAKVESNINELKSFQSNASDFDSLSQNWANAATGMTFNDSYIGKDGWFSNKAKDKAADLRRQIEEGNTWVQRSLANNANNISNTQINDLLANYTAYGGPLFAEGGKIHIKPSKRGTFTAAANRHNMGVQEFASKVLANKENYSTAMVKKANFARNASKWKHALGGNLLTHGATFDTGINIIENGGTHEENPYEGVLMGVDQEGVPNLVEEGEVIFNDYVFSNRLKVPKAVREKYKLRGTDSLTFADAAIKMSKESEERPNDPISQAGLEDGMFKLMMAQEQIREKKGGNKFAKGGRMGRIYAGEEDDPYSQMLSIGGGPRNPSIMWALGQPREEPSFPIEPAEPAKNNMGIVLGGYTSNPTIIEPGESTIPGIIRTQRSRYPSPPQASEEQDTEALPLAPTWMRYVPAFASGAMSITDALGLTNKPDYSDATTVLEAAKGIGSYTPARFRPIGNYLTYRPFDVDRAINKLNAAAGATRRNLLNTSGGNRATAMAGLLAADNNYLNSIGELAVKADEANLAQRQQVEEFNRSTDTFNSSGFKDVDLANMEAQLNAKSSYLKGVLSAAELRQAERQASTAARSANLSNFINSLGDIGRENFSRNMIMTNPSEYYYLTEDGKVKYKGGYYGLSRAEQAYIDKAAKKAQEKYEKQQSNTKKDSTSRAFGGYLTMKKKR